MKSSKRKFGPQSVSEVLGEIIASKALYPGITNARLNEIWHQLMGLNISQYTDKISLRGSTLFVSLSNAALREELSYGKDKIIKMMNEEVGNEVVAKLVLR